MKVSAQATPSPETMPERRFFESVRWMHSRHGADGDRRRHAYAESPEEDFDVFESHGFVGIVF